MKSGLLRFIAYPLNIYPSLERLLRKSTRQLSNPKRFILTTPPLLSLPKPPALVQLKTENEHLEASEWVEKFSASDVKTLRNLVELTFSRSSGPGGQNVNKVNTKASLRCPVNSPWIPRWAIPTLIKNPHYVASTHSILITSTVYRSQAQNIDDCLQKLHTLVYQAASSCIVKQASAEQKKKVEGFVNQEKERRKIEKMKRSVVKQDRRGRTGWDF